MRTPRFADARLILALVLCLTLAAPAWAPGPAVIAALGIPVFGAAVAEAQHWWVSPRSGDPRTLSEAVDRVKRMRANGASHDDIASWLAGVSDRRLTNVNSWEAGIFLYSSITPGDRQRRFDRFTADREYHGMNAAQYNRRVHPSDATEQAEWGWNLGVGNCNEHQSIAYYILTRAGFGARLVNSSRGHDFVVIGLTPGARINDPSTWGPNARVVDGWRGEAYTADEAQGSDWHFGGGKYVLTDQTETYGAPAKDAAYERMAGKGLLKITVLRRAGNTALPSATVTAGEVSAVTSAAGTADLILPVGRYQVTVAPPRAAPLKSGTANAEIEERVITVLSVSLEPAPLAPPPPARPASPPATAPRGTLRGRGTTPYPAMEVSGGARVTRQTGSVFLNLAVNLDRGQCHGELDGGMTAVIAQNNGEEMYIESRLGGTFDLAFTGSAESGRFHGAVTITESASGFTARAVGAVDGTVVNGKVICTVRFHEHASVLMFEFALRP